MVRLLFTACNSRFAPPWMNASHVIAFATIPPVAQCSINCLKSTVDELADHCGANFRLSRLRQASDRRSDHEIRLKWSRKNSQGGPGRARKLRVTKQKGSAHARVVWTAWPVVAPEPRLAFESCRSVCMQQRAASSSTIRSSSIDDQRARQSRWRSNIA